VVFAIAGTAFILMTAALVFMEVLRLAFKSSETERKHDGRSPLTGYFGLVSSVMAGPAPKVFRSRALTVMVVSAVVALVASLV
jgi:uncharacterized membrane protein